ncbi:hypothetical protein AB0D04_37015 [Streptomyces sp. NPDC048483]|uniref:hypothetical protein n=1 Tax=Streptomyces sp. NPDC048483 TaxID=3154927 RepID=UPI0034409697
MNTRRHVRAGGAMAQVLLVVVLALGVFVMHTVGHPDGSSGSGTHTGMDHATGMDATSQAHASPETRMAQSSPAPSAHAARSETSADPSSHYAPGTGTGMNMASLCMAVLGTWALATLLQAALARRPGWLADLLASAVVMLRPNPPPRGPDLTRLSVLRI